MTTATKLEPPNYDMTFCVSDLCPARESCARNRMHYDFKKTAYWQSNFEELDGCEQYIEMEGV